MNVNDEETLGLINRLLEWLHQADLTNFCSHLQIVYVASGGQQVENQIVLGAHPGPPQGREKGEGDLPNELATARRTRRSNCCGTTQSRATNRRRTS